MSDPYDDFAQPRYGRWDRVLRAHGTGDITSVFGDPSTTAPVSGVHPSKRARIDHDLVKQAITETLRGQRDPQEIDPRWLHMTQSGITRGGVDYYMNSDRYSSTGRTYADEFNPGNRLPVVYQTNQGAEPSRLLLSGHHRAAASLIQGRPLLGILVHGR